MSRQTSTPQLPNRIDGYLSRQLACGQYKVSFPTLWTWADKGCPYLGGKRLPTKRIPGAQSGKFRTYFHEATLDRINLARTGGASDAYLLPSDIEQDYSIASRRLERWRVHCPYVGRPIKSRIEILVGESGFARRHRTYDRSDLDAVSKAIAAIQPRDDYLTYQQLRKRFGTRCPSQKMLRRYATRGCRFLGGRKLAMTVERQRLRDRDMAVPHYLASQVAEIIDASETPEQTDAPHRDADGVWLPAKAVEDVRANRLHALAAQGRIRAKQIERYVGGRTNGKLWVYHEDDVNAERRHAAQNGHRRGPRRPAQAEAPPVTTTEPPKAAAAANGKRNRGGRPLTELGEAVRKLCYELHQSSDLSLARIKSRVNQQIGQGCTILRNKGHVTTKARQHAKANNLPFQPRN